jgi:cytochrome c peroxidase
MRHKYVLGALLLVCSVLTLPLVLAQSPSPLPVPTWLNGALQQALSAPLLPIILSGNVPATLPQKTTTLDATGQTTTYFPSGAVTTANIAFFQSLGTNGRTCLTCHQPGTNWSITPTSILITFAATLGKDPLFAPVDGADCPNKGAANDTFGLGFIAARTELFGRGDIRIFLPPPANPQWVSVAVTSDPTGCESSSVYGINNPTNPTLSFYRRPLPATNVIYTTPGLIAGGPNIMWDTREPSLSSQFRDATLVHAQASSAPTAAEIGQGVTFQSGSFTAQSLDFVAGDLTGGDSSGALGGPVNLYNYSDSLPYLGSPFAAFGGGSCSVPVLPCPGSLFPSATVPGDFNGTELFSAFATSGGSSAAATARRESIARGEVIFNTRTFTITNVTGLNDVPGFGAATIVGTCSRCHNNANVGNDAFDDPKHIGIADNSALSQTPNGTTTIPMAPDQPVFTFLCPQGTIRYFSNPVVVNGVTYDEYQTSDPGVGWITGQCSDLGKFKVSSLRGIGARAPFFHGGQAANMQQVILFYNNRFSIGLSGQDIQDLVNYMNSL